MVEAMALASGRRYLNQQPTFFRLSTTTVSQARYTDPWARDSTSNIATHTSHANLVGSFSGEETRP